LAAAVGAPYLPPSATMALQAGKWIGDMAPEAEKVLGPAARKAAYRYRGTEKKPDENWQKGINALRREFEDEEQAGRKAHDAMIKGRINPETKRQQDSAVISNFKKILTDASRYKLNLASGSVPPSQGIIIDRKGQVITEAVGYGEDWYLPFDLKNLNKLDGGEYIRTRAYGGPTTEDVLVGLVSGARAVTVVSHSGVFTIEFDDTFRGSRRYNDKAGRMQDRYASLLDAVKSRRVSVGDIPKSRRDEIDAEAAEKVDPADNPKLFKEEQRKLLDQEYENPKLSQAMKDNIAYPLLNDYAVERGAGNWEQYLGKLERDPKKREIYEAFKTPNLVEAAQRAGLGEQYKRDEADKLATYAVELSPLNLNGRGYHQAMQALKDQFPYYIKDVHFSGGVQKEDWGYVKPRYIRPEKALAGYFDPSITGQGKISADRTVYQNYTQEAKRGVADGPSSGNSRGDWTREPAEEDTGAGSSAGSAKPAAPRTEAQVDKLIAQIKALRSQKNFAAEIAEVEEEEDTPEYYLQQGLAGRVQSDETKKMIADQFGWDFLTNDVDDIEAALYAGGVNSPEYRRLRNKVDEAFDSGMYDIGPDDVDPTPAGALQPRPSNVSAMLRVFPALESGARFDFADVAPGENLTYYKYRIDNLVGGSKSLKSAGITSSSPLADIMDAVHARAEELKAEMVKYNAGRGDLSEDEVKREATAMAKVTQAAMLRDEIEPPSRTAPKKVASTPFASAPSEEEGATEEDDEPEVAEEEDEEEVESVPDLVARLKNTVGMKKVADEAGRVVSRAVWDQQEGGGRSATRHIVFTGNPGTGKSMVANMIAPLYYKLGVTSSPEITILKREDLVDIYKDGTAAKARAALERGKGGVIFIDEAHQLQNSDTDSGGKEALQVLVPFSTENKDDTVIILAGYGPGIHNLYRADDGLESRFPNTVHFDNYSADSLKQITSDWFEKDNFVLDPGATQHVQIAMKQIADRPNTANARDADTLYNKIIDAHAQRVQEQNIPQGDPRRRKITKIDAEMGMLAAGLTPPRPKKYK
jgi:stage V sporulation protein K